MDGPDLCPEMVDGALLFRIHVFILLRMASVAHLGTHGRLVDMHVYFSGIGGTGIGPLSLVAKQADFEVSGSDKQDSRYIQYLRSRGIDTIHIGQDYAAIAEAHRKHPIDWFVYSSAVAIEQADAPELKFCQEHSIKATKRDEFINEVLKQKDLKLIAVAGTHGKTTTTAMAIWLFQQLGVPISYSVGAKLSFADMGAYQEGSEYFIYEADEFDRNFLAFHPYMSIITGIDWDHPDIYPTRDDYYSAFRQFLSQSDHAFIWQDDAEKLGPVSSEKIGVISKDDYPFLEHKLPGKVNRENAAITAQALMQVLHKDDLMDLISIMSNFPGVSRRFEKIAENIYSDYAHTPPKIRGALQLAHEVAGDNVVVVYEGLHNTRQHFIKDELAILFEDVKQLYVAPSYLAREDPDLQLLQPEDLVNMLSDKTRLHASPATLNENLKDVISEHAQEGNVVLCLSAGGGGSLDEWLRKEFNQQV